MEVRFLVMKITSLILIMSVSCSIFADNFRLSSVSFSDSATLPVLYTCDGKGIPPSFAWNTSPANTKSFAITFADTDTEKDIAYHWIIYNIPSVIRSIDENKTLPNGTQIGKNSWNKNNYFPPCPTKGTVHTYVFCLYALDTILKFPADADAKTIMLGIKNHTIQKDDLMAIYTRWPE